MTQTLQAPPPGQVAGQPKYKITDKDRKRQERISKSWIAYDGDLDPPLQKMPGQPDDNVMSNRMEAIIERGVEFLFGDNIKISAEEGAPPEIQETIEEIWGEEETRLLLLQELATSGAIAGEAFLRIVPEPRNVLRLVIVDPSTVFTQTAPQDCETVLLYCIEYSVEEEQNGKPVIVYYREEIERIDPDGDDPFADSDVTWKINHWARIGDRGNWTPAPGGAIIWPYKFSPLFSAKNLPRPHGFWGKTDTPPALIGNNEDLNLVQSNVSRILKLYGSPIIYATGTGESTIDIKPGKIIGLPLSESKIVAVPITTDVPAALSFANNLRSDIDEQSSVPGVATGRIESMPRGNLSGIAIELLFMPLIKKTKKKRASYGRLIKEVTRAILTIRKMDASVKLTIAWPDPLPNDDLASAQTGIALTEVGVSKTTTLRKLGYDPKEEAELRKSEDQEEQEQQEQLPPALPGVKPLPGQPPAQPAQQPTSPFIGGE